MRIVTLIVLLGVSLSSAQPNYTVVFQHGEGGYPCIRIPSIARCGSTLHAFAECRTRIGDGCIPTGKEGLASGKSREWSDELLRIVIRVS